MAADNNDLVLVAALGLSDDIVGDTFFGEALDRELAGEFLAGSELGEETLADGFADSTGGAEANVSGRGWCEKR